MSKATRSAVRLSLSLLPIVVAGCADGGETSTTESNTTIPTGECSAATSCTFFAAGTAEDAIQNAFATAAPGWTLSFGEGTFAFKNQLSIGASNASIVGAGIDRTIFDFAGQASGSEGLFAQNVQNLRLEGFSIRDTRGNGVKVLGSKGVTFRRVKASWTGPDPSAHGAYGLYPVQSQDVLVEECVAVGASDAGLYIGQSSNVIVRNNEALGNVAGIEIENTFFADVFGNDVHDNTGGILIFDLPDLPQLGGHAVRVYDNRVHDNNTKNFAPPGNIVGSVPAGTGSFVMANRDVEFFGNRFTNNGSAQLAVVSYFVTTVPIKDASYYPYPLRISIHDNTFETGVATVDTNTQLGLLLLTGQTAFPNGRTPEVIYDGIVDPTVTLPTVNPMQICVRQPGSHFANLHLDKLNGGGSNLAQIVAVDPPGYDCTLPPLAPVTIPALPGATSTTTP